MNLKVMRKLDHFCGLPLCWIASFLTKLFRIISKPRKREVTGKGKIVVFKFFGLGSIIQTSPLLRAIKHTYPESSVLFLTFSSNETLVSRLDICDELIVIRTKNFMTFCMDVLAAILKFWKIRPEVTIDLEVFSKFSTLMLFLSRAPVRVGFHLNNFWRYNIVTHPIYFNYFWHISEIYSHAGQQIGVKIEDFSLSTIRVTEEESGTVGASLESLGWTRGQRLIGINVNASDMCFERRWPASRWHEAIWSILSKYPESMLVLTGSPDEMQYVEEVLRIGVLDHNRVKNMAGKWSFIEFVAALSMFNLFITNDSGPVHLAATTSVPVICLWGPQRPQFYSPRVEGHSNLYANYQCSPCVHMFTSFAGMWCDHKGDCMKAITVDEVTREIDSILGDSGNE